LMKGSACFSLALDLLVGIFILAGAVSVGLLLYTALVFLNW